MFFDDTLLGLGENRKRGMLELKPGLEVGRQVATTASAIRK